MTRSDDTNNNDPNSKHCAAPFESVSILANHCLRLWRACSESVHNLITPGSARHTVRKADHTAGVRHSNAVASLIPRLRIASGHTVSTALLHDTLLLERSGRIGLNNCWKLEAGSVPTRREACSNLRCHNTGRPQITLRVAPLQNTRQRL